MALTNQQIMTVVNRYIGVEGGYLGDFSYRTHTEFYPEYCGIDDVFPETYSGTTRQRFIEILSTRKPHDQAKILRGVIDRFGDEDAQSDSRTRLRQQILQWAAELEGATVITIASPTETRAVVIRALGDADNLVRTSGATSAVDRIHTALHGHLLALCESSNIEIEEGATSTRALKLLRQHHPALQATGPVPKTSLACSTHLRTCSTRSTRSGTTRASRTPTLSLSMAQRRYSLSTPAERSSRI